MLRIGKKLKTHFDESVIKGQSAVDHVLENVRLSGDVHSNMDKTSVQKKYSLAKELDIMEMWENLVGPLFSTVKDDNGWQNLKKVIATIEHKKTLSIPLSEYEVRVNDFFLLTAAKLYTTMMAIYQLEPAVYPLLTSTFDCAYRTYQHQIPSESPEVDYTAEGEDYKTGKITDRWCETKCNKFGKIIALTRETMLADRTGQIVSMCEGLAKSCKYREDQLAAAAFADSSNSSYIKDPAEQDAGSYFPEATRVALYRTSAGTTLTSYEYSINKVVTNLKNWTSVDSALQLLMKMVNLNSQYVNVMGGGLTIVVPTALISRASLLQSAMHADIQQNSTAGTEYQITRVPDPIKNILNGASIRVVHWKLLTSAATAIQSTWYLAGNSGAQFRKHESWPVEFSRATPAQLGQDDFNKDIIAKFKTGFRAGFRAVDDKYVIQCTNS